MNEQEKLRLLDANRPPSLDSMNFRSVKLDSSKEIAILEFEAVPEFCHSEAQIVQGGFVTGMMDASMALLLIGLLDFKFKIRARRHTYGVCNNLAQRMRAEKSSIHSPFTS